MLPAEKPRPSPAACLACRDRHVKCDGQMPVCARCASSGSECIFVRSRRGRRAGVQREPHDGATMLSTDGPNPATSQRSFIPAPPLQADANAHPSCHTWSDEAVSISGNDTMANDDEFLIGLYYRYIHPAHPFAMPEVYWRRNPGLFPAHLRKAMCFIASHHAPDHKRSCPEVDSIACETGNTEDAFRVQSLIIITLASYARFERDRGNTALNAAIAMARAIKLGSNDFGLSQLDIHRESWRRTWWELYTITGLISLIGGTNVRLAQPENMALPYSCETYAACWTAESGTPEQMQARFYSVSSLQWSSFAYRVEAMRILATVLDGMSDPRQLHFDSIHASISSYLLSLPADKSEGLDSNGAVDEVMTCALMIIHLAAVCLHFPRSKLARVGRFSTVCGTDRGREASGEEGSYSAASLRSARALTKLLSHHTSLKTLSPCFACAIAYSAVVQLSQYIMSTPSKPSDLRENLQLQLSALHVLGELWPIAHVVRSQLAQFVREVIGKSSTNVASGFDPLSAIDHQMTEEQWIQDLMNEEMLSDTVSIPFLGMPSAG